jgi:hypothetical protein
MGDLVLGLGRIDNDATVGFVGSYLEKGPATFLLEPQFLPLEPVGGCAGALETVTGALEPNRRRNIQDDR